MGDVTHTPVVVAPASRGAGSNYCLFDGKRLVYAHDANEPSALTRFVHDGFRALALNDQFTCVGAKAAIRQGGYRFGLYGNLGSAGACEALAPDLNLFVNEQASIGTEFTTFVASFEGPATSDEVAFEELLWATLQQLHELDALQARWDPEASADPLDPRFSFSFAGTALFIVGLHAASSRAARRFAWPTLVFNPHEQFDRLRASGQYGRFQQVIRRAETALQGHINPMLANFGEGSEARQYSGRSVPNDWRCPFQALHAERRDNPRETE